MRGEKHVGFELKAVSNLIDRKMNNVFMLNGVEDITPMHGMIMDYLSGRTHTQTYQRDIEMEFDITRSTVTAILKLMEKKGYVTRQSVSHDGRLKLIELTNYGRDSFGRLHSSIGEVEGIVKKSITPEEYGIMLNAMDKIKSALELE